MPEDIRRDAEVVRITEALAVIEARLIAARHLRLTDRIRLLEREKRQLDISLAELKAGHPARFPGSARA